MPRARIDQAVEVIRELRCPCPECSRAGFRLTDPRLSPNGWRHCRHCRCAWRLVRYRGRWYPVTIPGDDCEHWLDIADLAVDAAEERLARLDRKRRYH
ncbi:MAG TPA: hypothetical protein VFD49_21075 [Candidatus Dormibacteraeota bacterium]|nr:hypothetical protein [Candidatus Dormibacteraeota bacterium]